jgi:hypothetical protein
MTLVPTKLYCTPQLLLYPCLETHSTTIVISIQSVLSENQPDFSHG